ncbi:MAG: glycosyltransferase [Gammaproteobacteria bacterium]|nr:glycosyltransferase [Gammaproteobacteria bacterium]
MWVDDHHTLQQSRRSAAIGFVNFTGTAGIWRATAIEAAGGWRSASLVEDCELSFRALFAGFRTRFVRDVVVPAELPQTIDAYRLQQKRWTQGWAQLQRLHLGHLLRRYPAPLLRRAYLTYVMCISWQWPLWAIWVLIFPFLIAHDLWIASLDARYGALLYLLPPLGFALFTAVAAARESTYTYSMNSLPNRADIATRFARVVPYLFVNTAMLPHHVCAFLEGLFGPMHAEFERTPKTAAVTATATNSIPSTRPVASRSPKPRLDRRAYFAADLGFTAVSLCWATHFSLAGNYFAALGAAWLAACIAGLRVAQALPRAGR